MGYEKQNRGSAESYACYFAGMDLSMRQKVALVSSFFPTDGLIADMGSGSGRGSYDLASLYPGLNVVGIDISKTAVEHSRESFQLPNLRFEQADIAESAFPDETFDGILNSSVLHHVTSFNGFSKTKLEQLLDNQIAQLKPGGIIAIRDFVLPHGPDRIVLELPTNNGTDTGSISELSSAALFEEFIATFRCSAYPNGNIPLHTWESSSAIDCSTPEGLRYYRTSLALATEFVLRKDYRQDWEVEIQEEYTYYTKSQFESALTSRGLRLVISRNIFNPWIVDHRFRDQFRILNQDFSDWGYPPTNYLIVGEKTASGTLLVEQTRQRLAKPEYLQISTLQQSANPNTATNTDWDLVERPSPVIDVIPWFHRDSEIFVVYRQGYPRPISIADHHTTPPDDCRSSGYINEPLAATIDPAKSIKESVLEILSQRAGIAASSIWSVEETLQMLPSPGGINELVRTVLVEIDPTVKLTAEIAYQTGFTSRERIRAAEAQQLLRSYQVGGMFDARLEIGLYQLLHRLGMSPGPWIGAELDPPHELSLVIENFTELLSHQGQSFQKTNRCADFIQVFRGDFVELAADGSTLATQSFEYVVPSSVRPLTVAVLPYCLHNGELAIGLEQRELPAAENALGNSRLMTIPAWRLPFEVTTDSSLSNFVCLSAKDQFGLSLDRPLALGGSYLPSAGLTPEVVVLLAASVNKADSKDSRYQGIHWVKQSSMIKQRDSIADGHTLIALLRFSHAASANAN